jgi:hypothetical protein
MAVKQNKVKIIEGYLKQLSPSSDVDEARLTLTYVIGVLRDSHMLSPDTDEENVLRRTSYDVLILILSEMVRLEEVTSIKRAHTLGMCVVVIDGEYFLRRGTQVHNQDFVELVGLGWNEELPNYTNLIDKGVLVVYVYFNSEIAYETDIPVKTTKQLVYNRHSIRVSPENNLSFNDCRTLIKSSVPHGYFNGIIVVKSDVKRAHELVRIANWYISHGASW